MPPGETGFASDELIARVECLSIEEGDAYPGVLSVSRRRLSFLPIVRDATNSIEPWQIPMRSVRELELGAMEGLLTIRTDSLARSVMGTELQGLLESIEMALQRQPVTGMNDGNEQAVIEGPMDLYINNLLATRGHIEVTPGRVRFAPGRSLETMIWGDLGIDCPIELIRDVQLTGMRRRLVIETEESTYSFRGALAPRVFGVISALVQGGGRSMESVLVFSTKASLYTGPMTQAGELVLTRTRLRFTPAGRLEALIGLQREIDLHLNDMTRVDVQGLLDRRLVVSFGQEEMVFQVPKPHEKAAVLKDLMLSLEGDDDPIVPLHGARRATPQIMDLLALWGEVIGDYSEEEIVLFGPGLHQGQKRMFRRGFICLTSARVIFIPCGGPQSGERPLMASLVSLSAKGREDAPQGELILRTGQTLLRFMPRGGEGFIDTFFFLWREELERTDEFHFKRHGMFPRSADQSDSGVEEEGEGFGFVNRRETYRALLQGFNVVSIEVRSLMNPSLDHFVEARLRDISLGGCSVISEKRLPERAEFGIEVQIGEETATINARIVYCIQMGRNRVQWRQGLAFMDMEYKDAQLVRELVMRLQREELSRRSEFRGPEAEDEDA